MSCISGSTREAGRCLCWDPFLDNRLLVPWPLCVSRASPAVFLCFRLRDADQGTHGSGVTKNILAAGCIALDILTADGTTISASATQNHGVFKVDLPLHYFLRSLAQ